MLAGGFPDPLGLFVLTIAKLLKLAIYVYIVMIVIMVVISWVNPGAYNPLTVVNPSIDRSTDAAYPECCANNGRIRLVTNDRSVDIIFNAAATGSTVDGSSLPIS